MSDEFTLQNEINRAAKAQMLLDNELLVSAYDEIEKQLIDGWIKSPPRDSDLRERLWHSIHANRRHKEMLQSHISNGSLAQKELEKLHADIERKKKFGLL